MSACALFTDKELRFIKRLCSDDGGGDNDRIRADIIRKIDGELPLRQLGRKVQAENRSTLDRKGEL